MAGNSVSHQISGWPGNWVCHAGHSVFFTGYPHTIVLTTINKNKNLVVHSVSDIRLEKLFKIKQ